MVEHGSLPSSGRLTKPLYVFKLFLLFHPFKVAPSSGLRCGPGESAFPEPGLSAEQDDGLDRVTERLPGAGRSSSPAGSTSAQDELNNIERKHRGLGEQGHKEARQQS